MFLSPWFIKMNKQYRLKDEDWRLQGVSTIAGPIKNPYPGMKAKPGDVVKVCVPSQYKGADITLGLPNATALFLEIAYSAFQDITKIRESAFQEK
jgi:hypothetical protein